MKTNRDHLNPEEQIFLDKIGSRLKELRLAAGYKNYEDFARLTGVSRTQYGSYENGTNMRITNLKKIVAAHNLTLEAFFASLQA